MRLVQGILLAVLALSTMVIAGEPGNQAADKVVTSVMEEFDKAKTDADQKFEKATASFQTVRFKAVERAGKTATAKLERLQADSKKSGSDLGVEAAKQGIEDVDTAVQNAKLSMVRLDKLVRTFKGHSYLAVLSPAISWKDADKLCKDMGGHLAYIETKEKMDFLKTGMYTELWVGGGKSKGQWLWQNGKVVDESFWFKDRPLKPENGRDYLILLHDGLENHMNVSDWPKGFICEWE